MNIPIENIINENGVSEIFRLVVPSGAYAGTYEIEKPREWNENDSVIDIDEDLFFVTNYILGESTKLRFTEFNDPEAYTVINNVYKESGGDGRIIFKYIAKINGVEYDILADGFELNLNKYSTGFEKSMMAIDVELIKSEAENKFFAREDTTVNLLDTKDLDEKDLTPIPTFDIGFKKGDKTLSNFYTYDISQGAYAGNLYYQRYDQFFAYIRSSDYEFGDNTNEFCGYKNNQNLRSEYGPFVSTNITLKKVKIEITNFHVSAQRPDGVLPSVRLVVLVRNGGTVTNKQELKRSSPTAFPGEAEIKIDNEIYELEDGLQPGQNIFLTVENLDGAEFRLFNVLDSTTINITADFESPLVKTKNIRLLDAINQIAKNYTSSQITAESLALGTDGNYYNTSVSTGMYLRGLPEKYLLQKIKTSMKSLLYDGGCKLMALGYDILNNKLIVEDLDYFFKDISIYDLSDKIYLTEGLKFENDKDITYNSLAFGSTKYSTKVNFDITNFNTTVEISTPIKSNKNKFDKQTNLIIDPYKIQEIIEDNSPATNDNDDDLVLIDLVEQNDVWDTGIFENCSHSEENGKLVIRCPVTPFDTTLMQPNYIMEITEGKNVGTWLILSIDGSAITLNKTSGIEIGITDTTIKYKIDNLIKNRSAEGFTGYDETIRNPQSTTNIRHNPKYQMARWFPFFGSGLRKKLNNELLKVTNYKNNSAAKMTIVPPEMPNELQGPVVVGANEELGRMRDHKQTFFNGETIEITYADISYHEFMLIYSYWKFGEGNDRMKSRGYITCNTPLGIYDVYPFGSGAFSHNKINNNLTIKGKVKGKSVDNPTLLSVIQVDKNTVTVSWDYNVDYLNPVIKVQASLDGVNWTTVNTVNNVKTSTFSSDYFDDIITGTVVYFKVLVSTADYSNKSSNTLNVTWQFNDWIVKEISRTENINCGYSYLTIEITGTVNLEIEWNFISNPGGGTSFVYDVTNNNETHVEFAAPYGLDYFETKTTNISLVNETKQLLFQINNSNKTEDLKVLNCSGGNAFALVYASIEAKMKDLSTSNVTTKFLTAETTKKYFNRPTDPIGPVE
ncbi:hypothetical protein [Chryseobacterium proteolyticum]|uniref:hypothetical protein n=1 Tax=Chryseobacterium proteolyticum TaxID=118127 RepID=UPI0039837CCB